MVAKKKWRDIALAKNIIVKNAADDTGFTFF